MQTRGSCNGAEGNANQGIMQRGRGEWKPGDHATELRGMQTRGSCNGAEGNANQGIM